MNDPDLRPALRQLAARMSAVEPPAGMEAAVMAEFDRAHRRRPIRVPALCGALAASLLAGALLLRPVPPSPQAAESQSFYPIPYTPPLEPYERVMVVEQQVPVTELIAAGFHVPATDPAGTMPADVMVSQDGRRRAIRPVVYTGRTQ
jgi:hypothetical protein